MFGGGIVMTKFQIVLSGAIFVLFLYGNLAFSAGESPPDQKRTSATASSAGESPPDQKRTSATASSAGESSPDQKKTSATASSAGESSPSRKQVSVDASPTIPKRNAARPPTQQTQTVPTSGEDFTEPPSDISQEPSDVVNPEIGNLESIMPEFQLNDISSESVFLDNMPLGRSIQEGDPNGFERALKELLESDLPISLEDILQMRAKDKKTILDMMIATKYKREYFTKVMERILYQTLLNGMFDIPLEIENYERFVENKTVTFSFDSVEVEYIGRKIKKVKFKDSKLKPHGNSYLQEKDRRNQPISIASLMQTAIQSENKEAEQAVSDFRDLVVKIQSEYIEAQKKALDILKHSNRSSSWIAGAGKVVLSSAVTVLGGAILIQGLDITLDLNQLELFQPLLSFLGNKPKALLTVGSVASVAGVTSLFYGLNICSRAFRKQREISRQKNALKRWEDLSHNL